MHLLLCDIFFLSPVLGSVILVNFYSAISTKAQEKQIRPWKLLTVLVGNCMAKYGHYLTSVK